MTSSFTAITGLALGIGFAAGLALVPAPAKAEDFSFVALGDMPYGDPEKVYGRFEALIDAVNAASPDLVLHIGDTKSGGTPCSDAMLDDQLAFMNTFRAPLLYTPGDNEWTDCHRKNAGGFDPLDRLAYIRETYFADPGATLGGARVKVQTQAKRGFPENARMMHKGVGFITAHVVGSNNNFEIRDPAAVAEFFERDRATTGWMRQSFETFADADAIVLAIHADMFEFDFNAFGKERWLRHSGFARFGPALQKAASAFAKPVLLIYGDSHKHVVFRPFPETAPNVTALEVFGAKNMHAVEVTVDTKAGTFGIAPILNPKL
ncbi:MAG: metallophosphoesterase [Pseudomonadota bacterium]